MWTNRHLSDRTLIRLVDAELPGRRRALAERHVEACMSCAERVRALRLASEMVRPEEGSPSSHARLRARLRARLAFEQAALQQQRSARELATPVAVAACAALIAVAVLLGPAGRPAATHL